MLGHEIQQSAPIIASIAILIGKKIETLNIPISDDCSRKLSYIIKWDVKMIKEDNSWPERQKYSFIKQFSSSKEINESKALVHGYLGKKASSELEQFMTESELKRVARA